jgi:hypothetical protein
LSGLPALLLLLSVSLGAHAGHPQATPGTLPPVDAAGNPPLDGESSGASGALAAPPASQIAALRVQVEETNDLLEHADDPSVRAKIATKLDLVDRALVVLSQDSTREPAQPGIVELLGQMGVPALPPPSEGPVHLTVSQLDSFLARLDATSFSSDKLGMVQEAADQNWFTAEQIRQVLTHLSFGADKVEVGVLLHPRCVNPEAWHEVYAAFDFDSDARKLRARIDTTAAR